MPIMPFSVFIVLFGILVMLIGIVFIVGGAERAVIPLLFFHMATTIIPLFLLQSVTWRGFLVKTLEGQYTIKNILIIAAAIDIALHYIQSERSLYLHSVQSPTNPSFARIFLPS